MVENAVPGVTFGNPTAIAFLPDGRMLVAEKRGRVYAVENGVKHPTPLWSGGTEVLDNYDRGLLGIAVDPSYATNHYIYLLYTVDPDTNGVDTESYTFGRLTRYTVSFSDSNAVDQASRTILIGASWSSGIPSGSPSHAVGSLRWGADGTLLVSAGEGAQFAVTDPGGQSAGLFGPGKTDPYEDIGAFRAQYLGSLAGKILRIDPVTGRGLASNPFYDGDPSSNRSKVWAYGLRNPFRFTVRPGTGAPDPALGQPGTLYLGDVGWYTWEEAGIARQGGANFGWPCYEGLPPNGQYQAAAPSHCGCDSVGTPGNPSAVTPPVASWHHTDAGLGSPPGFIGNASVGGVFYTGTLYPLQYQGRYFFADYGQNWIRTLAVDASDQLLALQDFATSADAPVDLEVDPASGDLHYVSIVTGQVRRIRYLGTENDRPPTAVASLIPDAGPAPFTAHFSSAGSSDPDGDALSFNWLFGDGQGSTARNPHHTYASPGVYQALLSVSDGRGGIGRDTVTVYVDLFAFPTAPGLDDFDRPDGPPGGAWTGEVDRFQIASGALVDGCCPASLVWGGGDFGPEQEGYVRLSSVSAAPGSTVDLLLEVQGGDPMSGCIRVRYDPYRAEIAISTYLPGDGWQPRGGPFLAILLPGDQLGASVSPGGTVLAYRSGEAIAFASVAGTPLQGPGGSIGLGLSGAAETRLDGFGGGDYVSPNTPPEIAIASPADGAFFGPGDTLRLLSAATDLQQPSQTLQYRWDMDLHHNNHVHPGSFVSDSMADSLVLEDHDDGTGVWYSVRVRVTDAQGLSDTATVSIFPDLDLEPGPATTTPLQPGTDAPALYRFAIHNHGRMNAPLSHWRLTGDATLLAEGDTLVPARDSVVIQRFLPPMLYPGPHLLRVVADANAALIETREDNNASARTMTVQQGRGSDDWPPVFVLAPTSYPSGVRTRIRWKTNEPTTGRVCFGETPALPDTFLAPRDTLHIVLIENLKLGGSYFFQVQAIDSAGNVTIAALDSFTTQTGPLAAEPPPLSFALSGVRPNPALGGASLALELPRAARVELRVHDVAGREVWRTPVRALEAGRWTLEWPGRDANGARARPGVYLARAIVDGRAYVRRFVVLR